MTRRLTAWLLRQLPTSQFQKPLSMYSFEAKPKTIAPQRRHQDPSDPANQPHERQSRYPREHIQQSYRHAGEVDKSRSAKKNSRFTKKISLSKESIFDLRPVPKDHIVVDLAPFLTEPQRAISTNDVKIQTDTFADRPETPAYVPAKTGIDVSTQIEKSDRLFDFGPEVEPLLQVIVSKTLEQALLEVEEEEELAAIREATALHLSDVAAEERRVAAMAHDNLVLWEAKEKLVANEEARLAKEEELLAKQAAMESSAAVVLSLRDAVFQILYDRAHFPDPVKEEVVLSVVPWVQGQVRQAAEERATAQQLLDLLLSRALHLAAMQAAEAERVAKEKQGCFVRLFVKGLGLNKEEAAVQAIGPIPVKPTDTIAEVEGHIRVWLRDNIGEFVEPEEGFLRIMHEGRILEAAVTLQEAHVENDAIVELMEPEAA